MERRQDERHHENVTTLQAMNAKLDPLVVQMRQICGDENYRGRMGIAEDNIAKLDEAVGAIKTVIAKWSGIMIGAVGLIEVVFKLLDKWKP